MCLHELKKKWSKNDKEAIGYKWFVKENGLYTSPVCCAGWMEKGENQTADTGFNLYAIKNNKAYTSGFHAYTNKKMAKESWIKVYGKNKFGADKFVLCKVLLRDLTAKGTEEIVKYAKNGYLSLLHANVVVGIHMIILEEVQI